MAALDPRLGVQLERSPAGFWLSQTSPYASPLFRSYEQNKEQLRPAPLAVFVFSWLKRGGAEFVGANLLRQAQIALGKENVLVVVLDWPVLEARDWLDPDTRLFAPMVQAPDLSREERGRFLLDYLLWTRPAVTINCNSEILWGLTVEEGERLARATRLYAFSFCFDYTEAGTPIGYPVSHLPEALPHLAGVLGDHQSFKSVLADTLSLPLAWLDPFHGIYQPVALPEVPPRRRPPSDRPKILWASRICRQKRPELLIEIAKLRPDWDFEIYGDFYEPDTYRPEDFDLPNLIYRGEFDILQALPHEEFSAFLYTALYDGIPNIVLAAGAVELPIVTAAVGGIPETVTGDRGWLVTDHGDPRAYVKALDRLFADPGEGVARAQALSARIRDVHSHTAYERRVAALGLFDV